MTHGRADESIAPIATRTTTQRAVHVPPLLVPSTIAPPKNARCNLDPTGIRCSGGSPAPSPRWLVKEDARRRRCRRRRRRRRGGGGGGGGGGEEEVDEEVEIGLEE